MISLSPVVEGLKRVEKGVDKTASELAIARLNKEIAALEAELSEKHYSRDQWQFGFNGCGTFILIAGIVGACSGSRVSGDSLGIGLTVLIGVVLIFIGVKVFGESEEEKQLRSQIGARQAELTRHQQIVNM